jgi:hypothetical protein
VKKITGEVANEGERNQRFVKAPTVPGGGHGDKASGFGQGRSLFVKVEEFSKYPVEKIGFVLFGKAAKPSVIRFALGFPVGRLRSLPEGHCFAFV